MARYFIELSYDGALFGGFQIQQNKATVQGALEKAMEVLFRVPIALTGASRTDAGVHAYQNFLHFDTDLVILPKHIYNLNALLPNSVVVKGLYIVPDTAHCRFDAIKRGYLYKLHQSKDPFSEGRSWYYPFPINLDLMQAAADSLLNYTDFESFSKKNTQVNTFQCTITKAKWTQSGPDILFEIHSNRFLRGMIRGLVGTMLQVGRGQISIANWHEIVASKDEQRVDFSTPAYGLYLSEINYPNFLKKIG
ncbi:MAG: tRNA pseudouridine(38-40) synthase TruA [Sediminibacterium sp.]